MKLTLPYLSISVTRNRSPFTPCYETDEAFLSLAREVGSRRNSTLKKLYTLYSLAQYAPPGLSAEVGVYRGATAYILAKLRERLHVFDTFEGMPETLAVDDHRPGDFADTDDAIGFLSALPNVEIHKGIFPETAVDGRYAFVHVDVDIYQSVKDCLEFFVPRLIPGGIVVSDDYGASDCKGAKKAWDEYFADKRTLRLATGQAVFIN